MGPEGDGSSHAAWEFVRLAVGRAGDQAGPPPGVALITIDRPKSLNALNTKVLAELREAAEACAADPEARAVVVTGAGDRAFVAGADVREMAELDELEGTAFSLAGQAAFGALASMPKPVIAAIGGHALGGGLELALACDVRVASASATFGQPEVTLGICPGFGGTQRLARLIGRGRAKDLVFSGRTIGAQEAQRIGLVDRLADPGEQLKAAFELAEEMAAASPSAVAAAKEAIDRGADLPLPDGLRLEAALFGRCFATPDQKQGMRAFLEKSERTFRGR